MLIKVQNIFLCVNGGQNTYMSSTPLERISVTVNVHIKKQRKVMHWVMGGNNEDLYY
jgi:hypothetical protein